MSMGSLHSAEHQVYEFYQDLLMEKVTHRVDEHISRSSPGQRLRKTLRPKRQVEANFERVTSRATKPFGEALSIAMVTAGAAEHVGTLLPVPVLDFS